LYVMAKKRKRFRVLEKAPPGAISLKKKKKKELAWQERIPAGGNLLYVRFARRGKEKKGETFRRR